MDVDGMVAVVRGLPDANLAVTLLEGNRQYTLMPNTTAHPPVAPYVHMTPKSLMTHGTAEPQCQDNKYQCYQEANPVRYQECNPMRYQDCNPMRYHEPSPVRYQESKSARCQDTNVQCTSEGRVQGCVCDTEAQAIDGRYASVYKMAHCKVTPTSPPVELTEFPPQKAELCRGQGNFEVGGTGSGSASFSPTRVNNCYRGAMCWPDRGAVFTPRSSHVPDPFADSLRKYPALSPDRSSEMVERLISFTQNKNAKTPPKCQGSLRSDSINSRDQVYDRRSSICNSLISQKQNESDFNIKPKNSEESPTRDGAKRFALDAQGCRRSAYGRNFDVRYLRDTKRVKDSVRSVSTYPYNHPVCPNIKERFDHLPPATTFRELNSPTRVSMETQADIIMMSKEVSTLPRQKISTRNVAVPLSPSPSLSRSASRKLHTNIAQIVEKRSSYKSIQIARPKSPVLEIRKSAQTCSSVEIPRSKNKLSKDRRSKSQEDFRMNDDFEEKLTQLIQNESFLDNVDEKVRKQIVYLLSDLISVSRNETASFLNNLVYNLKKSQENNGDITYPQQVYVMRNTVQNSSMQTSKSTTNNYIQGITDDDINNNLAVYTKKVVTQVEQWLNDIDALKQFDKAIKKDIATELTGDIVDRCKYLELNPDSKGTDNDQLEHLKYQIFKRINKVIGEDSLEIAVHAEELMRKLKDIPVPVLVKPVQNVTTDMPYNYSNCLDSCIYKNNQKRSTSPEYDLKTRKQINWKEDQYEADSPNYEERPSCPAPCCFDNLGPYCPGNTRRYARNQVVDRHQSIPSEFHTISFGEYENNVTVPSILKQQNSMQTGNTQATSKSRSVSLNLNEGPRVSFQGTRMSAPPGGLPRSFESSVNEGRVYSNIKQDEENTLPQTTAPSLKQLNEEYDEYLKNWVQEIPINASNPEEEALVDKMRLGIYNGIWKAITKLKMNPAMVNNEFYYQDVLDDEIEELLNLLPQTPELKNKKSALKSELVEKTTDMNTQIMSSTAPATYKQQLIDNVTLNMPRTTVDHTGEDLDQLMEDLQKINLAEAFIMYTKYYRDEDRLKGNIYKKKLMKHIQEMFEALKKTHGKELKDIDSAEFTRDIMNALFKVPLPSDETIREEADEIQLGLEIEQWFADLPLIPTTNNMEIISRKRYRNALAKKLHDMDKQMNLDNCEDEVRQETMKLLKRLPLKPGETVNIPFMVDELVNRIKARPRDIVAGSAFRRPSTFGDPNTYDDFSRDMQLCSSFNDAPDANKPALNQSSYVIQGGERVYNAPPNMGPYVQNRQSYVAPDDQNHSTFGNQPNVPFDRQHDTTTTTSPQKEEFSFEVTKNKMDQSAQRSPVKQVADQASSPEQVSTASQTLARSFDAIFVEPLRPEDSLTKWRSMNRDSTKESQQPKILSKSSGYGIDEYAGVYPDEQEAYQNEMKSGQAACCCCSETAPIHIVVEPEATGPCCVGYRSRGSSPTQFSGQPLAFSTPKHNEPPPRQSKLKKRMREIDRPRRDAAKRRQALYDSDETDGDEIRCRCMERVWRCRKKRGPSMSYDDFDMDFAPCFPRYPPCAYFY